MSKQKTYLVEAPVDSYSDEEAFDISHNHVHHNGWRGRTVQITRNVAFARTHGFARGLIIAEGGGVVPVSLVSVHP